MIAVGVEQAHQIAIAQHQAGQRAAAEATCRRILAQAPHHAGALHRIGLIAIETGRCEDATKLLAQAIEHAPGEAIYHSDLGAAYRRLGRLEEAVASFQRALDLGANEAFIHINLGEALQCMGRLDEAIACHERALALSPDSAQAHNNLGIALAGKAQWTEAIGCFERAVAIDPRYAEAHANLGHALGEFDRLDEAIECCERAAELNPNLASAHWNRSIALLGKCECEQALPWCRRTIECDPAFVAAHWNLAVILMLIGRYEEGWREHEWRWTCVNAERRREFSVPQWDGTFAPDRTILLHAEQGFGDAIQFMRYVPLVRQRVARVIVECQPELVRLLTHSGGWGAEIVARGGADSARPFDVHLPLPSLPLVLGKFEPLGMAAPYLRADPALRAHWRDRLGAADRMRVGIAWAGNPDHARDRSRSIDPQSLVPPLRSADVSFYSLQVNGCAQVPAGVIDLTADITDFADTAALIAELDLIITADTAVAHLAGALGRPVWTLVPFLPDWRWGLNREDTPWYPTMRLFRQRAAGDWDEVIARVAAALGARAQHCASL